MARKKKDIVKLLIIKNELTINNINDQRNKLLAETKDTQEVHIKLENINQIDLAGIQLILALKKSFTQQNKVLKIDMNLSKDSVELLLNAGFKDFVNYK